MTTDTQMLERSITETQQRIAKAQPSPEQFSAFGQVLKELHEVRSLGEQIRTRSDAVIQRWEQVASQSSTSSSPELYAAVRELADQLRTVVQFQQQSSSSK